MQSIKTRLKRVMDQYHDKAGFIDVRIISGSGSSITFNNHKIEDVSKPSYFTGIVRAFNSGGWGYATFNSLTDIKSSIGEAVNNSSLTHKNTEVVLADVDPVEAYEQVNSDEKDFVQISLDEKLNLIQSYDKLIAKSKGNIVSSRLSYNDMYTEEVLINSQGTYIESEKGYVVCALRLNSQKGNVLENYTDKIAQHKFSEMKNKEEDVNKYIEIAQKLVESQTAKSGMATVILSPSLAGVFAHEAFGHLSEGDNVYQNNALRKVMRIGKRFGSDLITIVDDPTITGHRGSYKYDDEGTPAQRAVLLSKGILTGRLHNRETAGTMGELPNGHGRSQGASEVIPRMGITFIEKGANTFDEMVKTTQKGIYCVGWQAGNTDHERFTFTAAYGFEIKNGNLGRMLRNVKLAGNLFDTLKQIDMVGNKIEFEGGTCGKRGQYVPETSGAPHVRIKEVMIMGV